MHMHQTINRHNIRSVKLLAACFMIVVDHARSALTTSSKCSVRSMQPACHSASCEPTPFVGVAHRL